MVVGVVAAVVLAVLVVTVAVFVLSLIDEVLATVLVVVLLVLTVDDGGLQAAARASIKQTTSAQITFFIPNPPRL